MVDRGACLSRRPGPEVRSACSTHPKALIGADGSVGQAKPAALAAPDHGFDRIAQKSACDRTVAEFSGPLQAFPGDLEGFFKQLGERNCHGRKTIRSCGSSFTAADRRTMADNAPFAGLVEPYSRQHRPPVRAKAEGCGVRGTQRCAKLLQSGKREWTWTRSSKRRSTNPAC